MLIVLVYMVISILALVLHNCGYSVLCNICISIVAVGSVLITMA